LCLEEYNERKKQGYKKGGTTGRRWGRISKKLMGFRLRKGNGGRCQRKAGERNVKRCDRFKRGGYANGGIFLKDGVKVCTPRESVAGGKG